MLYWPNEIWHEIVFFSPRVSSQLAVLRILYQQENGRPRFATSVRGSGRDAAPLTGRAAVRCRAAQKGVEQVDCLEVVRH